jgi:predicted nucleic acid-binding protein
MEEVYLTSDILIHYFLSPPEPDAGQWGEEADAARKAFEVVKERHDRAASIVNRIFDKQLTAYISDLVLIEAVKAFEEISYEEPQDPENPLAEGTARLGWATKKSPTAIPLRSMIVQPNIVGIDKSKWDRIFVLYAYADANLSFEAAYHAATVERLKRKQDEDIVCVSFDGVYSTLKDITYVDPSSF